MFLCGGRLYDTEKFNVGSLSKTPYRKMSEDELLDDAAERTYQEMEKVGGEPSKLPLMMQPIAILYSVHAMADNGGSRYLSEGDVPFSPPTEKLAQVTLQAFWSELKRCSRSRILT